MFLLLVLILTPFTFAIPPVTQASTNDNELTVIYPKTETFKADVPIDFHIHVFNSSGHALNTSKVGCYMHIYNETNNHIFIGNFTQDSNGVDLKVALNSSVMSQGTKSYIISCGGISPQIEQGFLSSSFYTTTDGFAKSSEPSSMFGSLILVPLFFAFLLLFGAFSLAEEHSALRIFLFLLSTLMILLTMHFTLLSVIRFYNFTALQDVIGTTTYWMSWTLTLIVTYFIIYFVWKAFDSAYKGKIERMNY